LVSFPLCLGFCLTAILLLASDCGPQQSPGWRERLHPSAE
jgi:hypothetical protein